MGVTKAPFVNFSFTGKFGFGFVKVWARNLKSRSYLPGVSAARLRQPVKYERDIIYVTCVLMILKNRENNETEKIGLVTPTLGDGFVFSRRKVFGKNISNILSVDWWPRHCPTKPFSIKVMSLKTVAFPLCYNWQEQPVSRHLFWQANAFLLLRKGIHWQLSFPTAGNLHSVLHIVY